MINIFEACTIIAMLIAVVILDFKMNKGSNNFLAKMILYAITVIVSGIILVFDIGTEYGDGFKSVLLFLVWIIAMIIMIMLFVFMLYKAYINRNVKMMGAVYLLIYLNMLLSAGLTSHWIGMAVCVLCMAVNMIFTKNK